MDHIRAIIIYHDNEFSNPIIYTFEQIFSVLGIEYDIFPYSDLTTKTFDKYDVLISYGYSKFDVNARHIIHIYQSKLFSKKYGSPASLPDLPLKRWDGLPIIYEGKGDIKAPVLKNANIIETNIDIIASSFFMLSRYEEIILDERDNYDRFPAEASIAYKEDFLNRPIVNDYIDLMWDWIVSFNTGPKRKKFWGQKDFAVCLTHDVDDLGIWSKTNIPKKAKILLSSPGKIAKVAAINLGNRDPYLNLYEFIELEKNYGFSSSFYFFGGGKSVMDADYSINIKKVTGLISRIQEQGNEIGLHGSFDSYNSLEILQSEKENFQELVGNIFSIRQHYLRFDVGKTYSIYEKLSIKCDVTLGFAQHTGFRGGICLPFRPYNIEEDRPFDLIEIPLTIMDGTLMNYRQFTLDQAWHNMKSLLDIVKQHNGCAVLLWHKKIIDSNNPDSMNLYRRSIEWIAENNGLGSSAKEIFALFYE